jgi:tetratricopeptide (TPR) repeat protein
MSRLTLAATLTVLSIAAPALAQGARASGVVRDLDGNPIKGATVMAINSAASPSEITSTTDDGGRFAMIGLASGTWTFVADAPGFGQLQGAAEVRVSGTPPLTFSLTRDPGPAPGALDRGILVQVTRANVLRDQGQYGEAIDAYEQILRRNPKLTSLGLVIAGVYRQQAAAEADPSVRRALLARAEATYTELLGDETTRDRAAAELEATRAEAAGLSGQPQP